MCHGQSWERLFEGTARTCTIDGAGGEVGEIGKGIVKAMFVISPPFTGMLATCFRLKDVASFAFSVWSSGASLLT
jgi:hypothetical protein